MSYPELFVLFIVTSSPVVASFSGGLELPTTWQPFCTKSASIPSRLQIA